MDILLGFGRYEGGGFTSVITGLARSLMRLGHNPVIAVRKILIDKPDDLEIKVVSPKKFIDLAKESHVVNIHTSFPFTREIVKEGLRGIFTFHGYCPWYLIPELKEKVLNLGLRYVYGYYLRKIPVITSVSPYASRQLRELYGLTSLVIPNGLDYYMFAKDRIENRNISFKPLIFNATSWNKQKGLDKLIEHFRFIRKRYPNAGLLVIRPNNPDKWTKRIYNKVLPYEGNVIIAPFNKRELPVKYYLLSDIYLLTSRWESFSLPIIESFSAGLPVLALDRDDARRDHILASQGGLLYKGKTDLIPSMDEILENWKFFSRNGRKYGKKFDWNRIVRLYLDVYEGISRR